MSKSTLPVIEADLRAGILNNRQIGKKHGVRHETVGDHRRKLGLPTHKSGRRHPVPTERADIEAKLAIAQKRADMWARRAKALMALLEAK